MLLETLTWASVLHAILFGILVCLGWSAMAAVWAWLTSQSVGAAVLGLIVIIVVVVVLVVGVR
jgi:hypothetical protein